MHYRGGGQPQASIIVGVANHRQGRGVKYRKMEQETGGPEMVITQEQQEGHQDLRIFFH
jgi:hypothetical protein